MDYSAMNSEQLIAELEKVQKNYDDLGAERESFKKENETLVGENKRLKEELQKTKTANYTLIRRLDTGSKVDAGECLHNLFK